MTDLANPAPIAAERPRPRSRGIIEWLRVNLFGGVFNTVLTLLALYLLVLTIPPFIRWAFIDAVADALTQGPADAAHAKLAVISRDAWSRVSAAAGPEVLSIKALRSAGNELYLAGFMTNANGAVLNPGSVACLATVPRSSESAASCGNVAPWTMPLASASCASGG